MILLSPECGGLAAAIADHVRSENKSPQILVGYDTRCFSDAFALAAARVLDSRGCKVLVCDGLGADTGNWLTR